MVGPAPTAPAATPPDGLDGLDPSWSRLVHVPAIDGVGRTWHLLDNLEQDPELTLLCVHGNPSWSYLFRHLLAQAPPGVRVIAVDQLEMGFSERSGKTRRLATRVDDLCALTEELALTGPVVTVAHDWGGPISLGWAQRHRSQLQGVVLMNTAVHQPAGSRAPGIIRLARSRPLLNNVTVRTDTFVRGAIEMSRPRLPAAVRRGFLAPYQSADRRTAIGDFVADIPLSPEHPSAAALDAIAAGLEDFASVPTLLLWGSADPVFSDLYLHDFERRLPHAQVHRYPKASHFVSEEVDTTGAVFDWLSTLSRANEPLAPSSISTLPEQRVELGSKLGVAELPSEQVSFTEFARLVNQTAAGLVTTGVTKGDRVALMIPPGIDLAVSLYAGWRIGATAVLVDAGLGPKGMSAAIRSANPDYLVGIPKALAVAKALRWPGIRISTSAMPPSQRRLLSVVADLPTLRLSSDVLPAVPLSNDTAAIVFTSGATGPSKGVRYTHGQLEAQRDTIRDLYSITTDDRLVAAFAPFALYGPALGISSIVPDMDVAAPGTLTANALGDAAARVDATLVFASPAALANVVATASELTQEHRDAFGRVRLVLSAGAPVRPSLLKAALALFPNATAHTPYGMTECLPATSISLSQIEAAGSGDGVCVGQTAEGVEVQIRVLDTVGSPTDTFTTETGVLGEVVLRAAHARDGYDRLWHTEFKSSQPAGWHATGDLGSLDAQGRLWIGGRIGHLATTPTGSVAPVPLEQEIEAIDEIAAAAIVGIGPPGRQQLVAVIQPTDAPRSPRLASLERIDRVRASVNKPIVAVFEVPQLPVDRRHNSKVDRQRVADWAETVLAGGRLGTL